MNEANSEMRLWWKQQRLHLQKAAILNVTMYEAGHHFWIRGDDYIFA
jgi:hypothetical protein